MFQPPLTKGEVISNRKLMDIFHCACEGGIRYSSRTETVVVIVNNTKSGLPNKWENNILEFAGRPLKKDITLTGANRRLEQTLLTGGDIFVFVVNEPGMYEYKGKAEQDGQYHLAKAGETTFPVFPLRIL